jgi:hypothetical protein
MTISMGLLEDSLNELHSRSCSFPMVFPVNGYASFHNL